MVPEQYYLISDNSIHFTAILQLLLLLLVKLIEIDVK